jgi:ABC-2 type transport system permease protein
VATAASLYLIVEKALQQVRFAGSVALWLLSGGNTPVESQPRRLQAITYLLPSRHFVSFSQVIVYRGGGIRAIWPQFLRVTVVGLGFFTYSVSAFRKSIAVTK